MGQMGRKRAWYRLIRRPWVLAAPVAVLALAACGPTPSAGPARVVAPAVRAPVTQPVVSTTSRYFAPDSPWNAPIPAGAAIDPAHAAVSRWLAAAKPVADLYEFGVPIWQ